MTPANRDEVIKILKDRFVAKKFDDGLIQTVAYLGKTFAKPVVAVKPPETPKEELLPAPDRVVAAVAPIPPIAPTPPAPPTPPVVLDKSPPHVDAKKAANPSVTFNPMWIAYGLGGLLVLWLLIGILRALFGAGRRPTPPPTTPTQPVMPNPSGGYAGPAPSAIRSRSFGRHGQQGYPRKAISTGAIPRADIRREAIRKGAIRRSPAAAASCRT